MNEQTNDTVKSRLYTYLSKKNIRVGQFCKSIGVSPSFVSSMRKSIQPDKIKSIALLYPDLNTTWLLTGEGEMLTNGIEDTNTHKPTYDSDIPRKSYTHGVPYYNVDFIGGFDLIINDQSAYPEYYVDFKEYNCADCWCNVTGHSMEPEINQGDIVALKELQDWRTYIPAGEIYGIVTTEHRTIKKVSPSQREGYIRLIPINKSPEYVPQEIPLNIVLKVYKVLGCMKKL